jgi:hypothetical protein
LAALVLDYDSGAALLRRRKFNRLHSMNSLNIFLLPVMAAALAGCSSPGQRPVSKTDGAIQLSATMPSRFDVVLKWQDPSANCAGHIVEFATESNGPYTILAYWPSDHSTYTHPRLIPDTTFYYRVRPYCGAVSATVDVSLPAGLSDAEYARRYAVSEDYSWGAPATIPTQTAIARKSIRDAKTATASAPSDLKAVIVPETVSGVHLTWTDHDTDAEGYLIEMKADDSSDWEACAVVPPNINSFGWSLHPPERKGSFRVRAYYLGKPSNLVSERTGPESEANYMIPK